MRWLIILSIFALVSCNSSKLGFSEAQSLELKNDILEARKKQHEDRISYDVVHDLKDLQYYETDLSYTVEARFKSSENSETIDIPTYSNIKKEFFKYGTLEFELKGKHRKLTLYRSLSTMKMPQYKNHLFLPFMDLSSGESSYGGGRYIDMETTDIVNGKVILDFNQAYNPYCAYGDGWNCPIPPIENHLDIAILAGERAYTGPKKNRF